MRKILALTLAAALALAGCSRAAEAPSAPPAATSPAAELRLGYFPNITHAPAIIGVANGFFTQELGSTKLTTQTFNAGGDEISALLGGSLDAGFIGSSPAINGFAKSNGEAVRVIAGSTSGGAQLVVSPDITSPEQLKGKIIATPQKGNTQDVALKKWLKENNLEQGQVGQGHRPEPGQPPHARPVQDQPDRGRLAAGAVELPARRRGREGARRREDAVAERAVPHHRADRPHPVPAGAPRHDRRADPRRAEGGRLRHDERGRGQDGDQRLDQAAHRLRRWRPAVLDRSFTELQFTLDPLAATFPQLAKDSVTAGVTDKETNLKGFIDVTALNGVLTQAGKPAVDAAGLDKAQG